LRLRPGMPDAHMALAYYWDGRQDVAQATRSFERAIAAFPQNAELHMGMGYGFVRLSQWDNAVAAFQRAMEADPSDPNPPFAAALFLLRVRRDDEAIQAFDRALALRPDYHMVKVIRGHTYLRSKGAPDSLAAAMRTIPPDWDPEGMATFARYSAMRAQRRYAEGLAMLNQSRAPLSRDGLVYHPHSLMRAQLLDDLGDRATAEPHYREAAALLVDSLAAHPDNASIRVTLALAYAGLGRKQDAIAEARRAIAAVPISQRVTSATAFMGIAVEAFARIGEIDAALDLLELLFAMPAGREVTVPYLRLWPGFDPLRNDPRFEALLTRFSL
jgi:tetratricopeptide (TPR) repeat protein